jgi:hypothetical protein
MKQFELMKPTLDLLIKDSSDAGAMTHLLGRFLEQNVGEAFVHYLDDKNLMNEHVWLNLSNEYYVQMPKEQQTKTMTKFLYQHSLDFIAKFVSQNDNKTVESFLSLLIGRHSVFQNEDKLFNSWLHKKEVHFFEHLFEYLQFTPYNILRKSLTYMVKPTGAFGYSLEFDNHGLALVNQIYQRENAKFKNEINPTFLSSMDSEVLFNSNFSPVVLPDLIKNNQFLSHYESSWGHSGNKTGLNQMVFSPNRYPYGNGRAISEYFFINPHIDFNLFTQIIEQIKSKPHIEGLFLNSITDNKFLAGAIQYDVNKVMYVIDTFELNIKKNAILDYKELVNANEQYLDNLTVFKNHYTGENTINFTFNFILNAIIHQFDLGNEGADSRLEKLLNLTNKKQLSKKELYSNAIKYLNHQKTTKPEINQLIIFMEKIYFELENQIAPVENRKKMKI